MERVGSLPNTDVRVETGFGRGSAALLIASGGLVLFGWAWGLEALKSLSAGLVTMKANTAACFVLCGISLWALGARGEGAAAEADRARRMVALLCAGTVVLVACVTAGEYLFGVDLGVDGLLFPEAPGTPLTSSPGRMSALTAAAFLFAGGALLSPGTRRGWIAAQARFAPRRTRARA